MIKFLLLIIITKKIFFSLNLSTPTFNLVITPKDLTTTELGHRVITTDNRISNNR